MFFNCEHSALASALHKEATVLIKSGELNAAIDKLKEAKLHLLKTFVQYPIDSWSRVAYVMQKAGRFEEAMLEMDFLLSDIKRSVRNLHEPTKPGHFVLGPSEEEYQFMEERHREIIWRQRRILQIREIKRLRKLQKKSKQVLK